LTTSSKTTATDLLQREYQEILVGGVVWKKVAFGVQKL